MICLSGDSKMGPQKYHIQPKKNMEKNSQVLHFEFSILQSCQNLRDYSFSFHSCLLLSIRDERNGIIASRFQEIHYV